MLDIYKPELKEYAKRLRSPDVILTLVFCFSRYFYQAHLNVFLSIRPLNFYWQYLDRNLLADNLLTSLFFLHQQPPLYNFYLGLILKCNFFHPEQLFQWLAMLMGFLYMHCLYRLMLEIKVKGRLAFGLTILHTVLPTTLLYENWLFYTYPIGLMFCASGLCLVRFLKTYRLSWGIGFFSGFAALSLTRNILHFCLFSLWAFLIYHYFPREQKVKVIKASMIPFFALLLFGLKQLLLFGSFSSSSTYLVPNLVVRTNRFIPTSVRTYLLETGTVPPIYFIFPFQRIDKFKEQMPSYPVTSIPALDQITKSSGAPNFNNIGFFSLNKVYFEGLKNVLRIYPEAYYKSLTHSTMYFWPASQDNNLQAQFTEVSDSFNRIQRFYDRFLLLSFSKSKVSILLLITLPSLIVFGISRLIFLVNTSPQEIESWVPLSFMLFFIIWSGAVTILISWGDFNRYRVEVNSYYLVLLGLLLSLVNRRLISLGR